MLEFINRYLEFILEKKQQKLICKSCETLKEQLELANYDKSQMLKTILEMNLPKHIVEKEVIMPQPIIPRLVSDKIRREELMKDDREKARIRKELIEKGVPVKSTEELEVELLKNREIN